MGFAWLCGLLLFVQPYSADDLLFIEHDGEELAAIHREDYVLPFPGIPLMNPDKYQALLKTLDKQIYQPPENAYINNSGQVISEKTGHQLYHKAFTDLFYTYFYKNKSSRIEVPILPVHPRVDRDLLLHIGVKKIGQYVTYYNSGNKARSHNISLAAQAINNHVIFPGETFSFNRVVGKRTRDRGYMKAPVIVRGELAEDIGGGICQVSSTLFNAADHAGVKVIERYSHSRRVPYVPPGRDATVSWYGPDFTFKNDYSFPLLIRARAIGGRMIIRIFSSDEIEYEPRPVPGASRQLPKEIPSRDAND